MQWHEDTFDLPPGAVQLMTGTDCPAQAFRLGDATYAFQCHFEADPTIVEGWIEAFGDKLPRYYGEAAETHKERVRQEASAHGAAQRRFAEIVSDRWLDLVQGRCG